MRRKTPKAGDVWIDTDDGSKSETIILIEKEGKTCPQWNLLVTRSDGSTYFDWENADCVLDWYNGNFDYFTRVV